MVLHTGLQDKKKHPPQVDVFSCKRSLRIICVCPRFDELCLFSLNDYLEFCCLAVQKCGDNKLTDHLKGLFEGNMLCRE